MNSTTWQHQITKPLAMLLLLAWTLMGCGTLVNAAAMPAGNEQAQHAQEEPASSMADHACCSSGAKLPLSSFNAAPSDAQPLWLPSFLWSSLLISATADAVSPPQPCASRADRLHPPPLFLSHCRFLI